MTFSEALKIAYQTNGLIRRPSPRYLGSEGDGWVSIYLLEKDDRIYFRDCLPPRLFTIKDMIQDDWEVKK